MTINKKPGTSFWIISLLALLWNIAGVIAYLTQAFMTDAMKALLPVAERELYETKPAWATAAFALAVFAGLLGTRGLPIRKKWATTLFTLSLLGILAHRVYLFFLSGVMDGAIPLLMVMPTLVTIIGFFLVWYSRKCATEGNIA
jgi:hypothetical protein